MPGNGAKQQGLALKVLPACELGIALAESDSEKLGCHDQGVLKCLV